MQKVEARSTGDDSDRSGSRFAGRAAFTLVELLVVIGIIALLVSILLPSLSRVREQANQTKCLSNLRQLGLAFVMYANENSGKFPFIASAGGPRDEDWIWWQSVAVPPGRPVADPEQSAIAKYMSGFNEESFRCPSDKWDRRKSILTGGPYIYSYTMNEYMGGANAQCPRIGSIHNSSEKIILTEEDELTINDGHWVPPLYDDAGAPYQGTTAADLMAIRHDRAPPKPDSAFSTSVECPNAAFRGNANFVDGHAEYVPRSYAHNYKHLFPLE